MPMGSEEQIEAIAAEGEIYQCPSCGYTDGFHVSFNIVKSQPSEVILICPNCHRRYRIGLNVTLN